MKYEVRWTDTSLEQLEKLNKRLAERIIDKVESIAKNPFKFVKKLRGFDLYRLGVGDYRAIMSIEGGKLVIFVVDVGHRKTVYRKY